FDPSQHHLLSSHPGIPVIKGVDKASDLYGIKWKRPVKNGTSVNYSIKVYGLVEEDSVFYALNDGHKSILGTTTGPGVISIKEDAHSISGFIYLDTLEDSRYQNGEPLLEGITVTLLDESRNPVIQVQTDNQGYYELNNLEPNKYTVHISDKKQASRFNQYFGRYFEMQNRDHIVTITNSDQLDISFSYRLKKTEIIADLNESYSKKNGNYLPARRQPIEFWKRQHQAALRGEPNAPLTAKGLSNYLSKVERLNYSRPFNAIGKNKVSSSYKILGSNSTLESEIFSRQLLALELNHVYGAGLLGNYTTLQEILIEWAEYIYGNQAEFTREEILTAIAILANINDGFVQI
ncbi:MAG: hypothetical protein OEX00_12635, partial [Gammaproteobacteria bacterium]|nr:hypothetical protein [Gammaproteobacteria bacterium]